MQKLLLSALFLISPMLHAHVTRTDCVLSLTNATEHIFYTMTFTVRLVGTDAAGNSVERVGDVRSEKIKSGAAVTINLADALEKLPSGKCEPITHGLREFKRPNTLETWYDIESLEILAVDIRAHAPESFTRKTRRGGKYTVSYYPRDVRFELGVVSRHMLISEVNGELAIGSID